MGFNLLLDDSVDTLFLNMTINDYLWYYKADFIDRAQKIVPSFVPTNNSGCLYQVINYICGSIVWIWFIFLCSWKSNFISKIYSDFNDRYNVRIGPGYDNTNFFTITTVNGGPVVPGFDVEHSECNASIVGSTEGALYKTRLTEESVLWYWRKPLCRQVPLYFEEKVQKGPFEAYKYVLRENAYDRYENLTHDCFKGFNTRLPNGLSDVSKCFFGRILHSVFFHLMFQFQCYMSLDAI